MKILLSEALALQSDEQQEFLASACGGDAALRAEVDMLLEQQVDTHSDVFEKCASDALRFRFDSVSDNATRVGSRIGSYRVLREVGHGGMGTVYLAARDDQHYHQQVAIKLIKTGVGGEEMRRRFRNEIQILADLNHPNIARLFDAGQTVDGVPYLVMEYVEGSPINKYCDDHELSTEQRLKLFCLVCDAVQYAHQHLIVHRDIKPGNVLVTKEGGPKLVDFGIAKLLQRDSFGVETTATAIHFMTPEYASPEQVKAVSVTTSSDVYSLGVVLYELLSGRLPYRLRSRMPHEVAKAICDQDPERPSTAIGRHKDFENSELSDAQTQTLAGVDRQRSTITKLRKRLQGDLDNIVLMAMRKEPERRYASVAQFAEDIHRHLNGLPVRARTDTFRYRSGKFIRRQKVAVTAAALIAVTLLFGIVTTIKENRVARAERARAERRFNEVRQLANSFVFEVHDAIANLPGSTPARSAIVQRGLKYLDSLAEDAAADRGLQRELAAAYEKLGAVQYTPSVAHLGDLPGAIQSHRKAAALRESLVTADPTNTNYRRDLLDSYWFIATLLGKQGDLPRELEMLRQQLPARAELARLEKSDFVDRYNLAGTYAYIGSLLMEMGDAKGALANQQEALRIREELVVLDPDNARSRRALSISYEYLGLATDQAGDTKSALELQRKGLQAREFLFEQDPLNTDSRLLLIESYRYVGDMLTKVGDQEQAFKHYQKQLTLNEVMLAADPTNAQFKSNHAVALIKMGDVDLRSGGMSKALARYHQALRIREQLSAFAPLDTSIRRDLAEVWVKIGDALRLSGAKSAALENYRKSLQVLETLSSAMPAHAGMRGMLAETYLRLGRVNLATVPERALTKVKRIEQLQAVRATFQRGLDIVREMQKQGLAIPNAIDLLNDPAKDLADEIAKCDAELEANNLN